MTIGAGTGAQIFSIAGENLAEGHLKRKQK
jgi:hypothetical protein